MAKVNLLKNKARREEQRENWSKAIELYTQALDASRKDGEAFADLSLYNRIGDIYLRIGQKNTAVRYYEQAIERYGEQDLHTSAIALCNKVLRIEPGRSTVFLQLGRLHLATNLIADARAHYHKYAESMRDRGSESAAFTALEELIEDTGDPHTVTLWVTWLATMEDQTEALDRIEGVRSSLIAHGIGPESLIEQVTSGVIESVEIDAQVDEQPDPLAGAFLSTTNEEQLVSVEADRPAEPASEGAEAAADESSSDASLDEEPADRGVDVLPSDRQPEEASVAETGDHALSAADQVVVPEPAPPELGSARWNDEAEELLAELNGPVEAAWAAYENESHEPPPVDTEPPRGETDLETDDHADAGADESALHDAESVEQVQGAGTPPPDRPWAGSTDLVDLEAGSTAEAEMPPHDLPARDPEEEHSAADGEVVLGDVMADALEPVEALGREEVPGDSGSIGPDFAAEPALVEDEYPEPEPAEPPEPDAVMLEADREDPGAVDAEGSEAGEPASGVAALDIAAGSAVYETEAVEVVAETGEIDALAAMEAATAPAPGLEVVAVPDEGPVFELSEDADDLVLDPPAQEATVDAEESVADAVEGPVAEPVAEVVVTPIADRSPEVELSPAADLVEERPEVTVKPVEDPAPTVEVVSDAELVIEEVAEAVEVVTADLGPTTSTPAAAVEEGSTAFLDSIESDITVEPEPSPDPDGDVEVTLGSVDDSDVPAVTVEAPAASHADAAGTPSGHQSLDDIRTPLAEPRLTLAEDPEDAFKDWVDTASLGVLKRALPELENRSETEKALLVIQRLARLEESAVEFKTKLVDYSEKLGHTAFAADACLQLAAAHLAQERWGDARDAYQRVLQLRPGDETATGALEGLGNAEEDQDQAEAEVRPTPYMPDHASRSEMSALLEMPIRPATPGNGQSNGHTASHPNGHGSGEAPRPYSGVAGGAEASTDFEALLNEFRAELHEKPRKVGSSSRTELGASLKEMGRLDDAIRELQAAINEPSPPPLAFELLAEAFLEKGQGRIAVRLLEKALGSLGQGDRELIGVLYQLGSAYESVSEPNKALICYERIFSVDIDYRDIQERIMACSA